MTRKTYNPESGSGSGGTQSGGGNGQGESGQPLRVLGDFELRRIIGRGGMGTVYEAWQRSLDRIVALKVLPEHFASSQKAVQRFQREAQAAGKLHHTHIIPIFARGEDNGTYYYAMELVHGKGLNAVITEMRDANLDHSKTVDLAETMPLSKSGTGSQPGSSGETSGSGARSGSKSPAGASSSIFLNSSQAENMELTVNHARDVAEQIANVADALEYAHAHGVIHRDIKPHNLMLGEDGRIRVADFGLARITEQPGVTMTGEVVGSPLYMAPELLTGGQSQSDHRADIYSLGATMYEWLTLSPPHPGDTREAVISSILTGEPAALREHNPYIPHDIETICLKAMERDPFRRYHSAGDLRDDIQRYLQRRSIRARRAGLVERARKFLSRHPVGSVVAVAAVVVLMLVQQLVRQGAKIQQRDSMIQQKEVAVADLEQDVAEITKQAAQLRTENFIDAARRASPIGEAGIDLIGDLVESGKMLAGNVDITAPDPVDLSRISTTRGIARIAAKAFYAEMVPDDYFSRQSVTGTAKMSFELETPHDPAYREEFPATALTLVNIYITKYGNEFDAVQLRAALNSQLGNFDDLAKDAQVLIDAKPNDPVGYVWRALARLMVKDAAGCLADMERVSAVPSLNRWYHTVTSLAFLTMGRPTDAINLIDIVLAQTPDFGVALLVRAHGANVLGDVPVSVAFLSKFIEDEPKNVDVLVARGIQLASLGDLQGALRDYNAAIDAEGPSATVLIHMNEAQKKFNEQTRNAPGPYRGNDEASIPSPASGPTSKLDEQRPLMRPVPVADRADPAPACSPTYSVRSGMAWNLFFPGR
ncbi:MAG: protein kinase domain-containing protein [Planctomycetota bacterium]